jgi:hypothetical protein
MRQQALVYRSGPTGERPAYVGKTEFRSDLAVDKTNSYLENRRWHFVRIDRIEPPMWHPHSEIVPTVFVSPPGSRPVRPSSQAGSRAVPRRGKLGSA